ncbi:MAG: lysylphosphatidylglycerol synthase domain-containing protein, partial [Candidatus Omnitrophota bacterium]
FDFRHFISVWILRGIFTFMICGLIGCAAGILYMLGHNTLILTGPVVFYVIVAAVSFSLFFIPVPRFLNRFRFYSKIEDMIKGVTEIKKDAKLMLYLAAIQAGVIVLFLTRYYIVFKALSLDTPFLIVSAVIPMTMMSDLVNLIPSNLAIREAIVSSTLLLIGYSLGEGILVASIDRAVMLAMILTVGSWIFLRMKYYANLVAEQVNA